MDFSYSLISNLIFLCAVVFSFSPISPQLSFKLIEQFVIHYFSHSGQEQRTREERCDEVIPPAAVFTNEATWALSSTKQNSDNSWRQRYLYKRHFLVGFTDGQTVVRRTIIQLLLIS